MVENILARLYKSEPGARRVRAFAAVSWNGVRRVKLRLALRTLLLCCGGRFGLNSGGALFCTLAAREWLPAVTK
jgi:hypothetical protein